MTPPHPETEDIAALTEDLLPPERAAALRAHLGHCESCAGVLTSLQWLSGELGTQGRADAETGMPADLAERLDTALMAAGRPETQQARPVSRETGTGGGASSRTESPARPIAPPRGPSGPGRTSRRRGRARKALLRIAGTAAALTLGGVLIAETDFTGSSSQDSGAASQSAKESLTSDAATHLEQQVRALLSENGSAVAPEKGPTAKSSPDGSPGAMPFDDPSPGTTLPRCVRDGIDRAEAPIATDASATFRGRDAYLVVLPHTRERRLVDAYVLDPACTTGATPGPADVLARKTVPRG